MSSLLDCGAAKVDPIEARPPAWSCDSVTEDTLPDWIPRGMRSDTPGLGLSVRRLGMAGEDLGELQGMIVEEVARARQLGASWQLVGLGLGISGEGARSRYGRSAGRPGAEASSSSNPS